MKCIHHNDSDGFCAAAIVHKFWPSLGEYHAMGYGMEVPFDPTNETVVMVDFSLQPFDKMIELSKVCKGLLWIDHHASSLENYEKRGSEFPKDKIIDIVLKDGLAGCELAWKYFSDKRMPKAVQWIGRYDVWDHEDPRVIPFRYGLDRIDTRLEKFDWEKLFDDTSPVVQETYENGRLIYEYQQEQDRRLMKQAFEVELGGLKLLAINKGSCGSLTFGSIWDNTRWDGMIVFSFQGSYWHFSMFTDKEGMDILGVAKENGGGGHVQACGFEVGTAFVNDLLATAKAI